MAQLFSHAVIVPCILQQKWNSFHRRAVLDVATSKYDISLAVIENSLSQMNEESVVRLYDVGRLRADEEDLDDAENDEENEDDGKWSILVLSLVGYILFWIHSAHFLTPNAM